MAGAGSGAARTLLRQLPSNIRIDRLTPALVTGATKCAAETFGVGGAVADSKDGDPFSWLLNLRQHHWRSMAGMFIDRAASKPYSVVAIDDDTGDVKGVMVNEDWKEWAPDAYRKLPSDWRPVRAIFNEVHTRYKAANPRMITEGEVFHALYFTCTHPSSQGQGIMQAMWGSSIDIARDHNFHTMVAEASKRKTREVLDKRLGFTEVASVAYEEFVIDNQTIFDELPEHNPDQWDRLSIHKRNIHSDLYI